MIGFALILGFFIEVALMLLWLLDVIGGLLFFMGHLLVMIVLGWMLSRISFFGARRKRIRSVVVFAYLIAFFIPPLGYLTGLAVLTFVWIATGKVGLGVYDEYEEYVLGRTELTSFLIEEDIAKIENEALFDPYIDILHREEADPRKSILIGRLSRAISPGGVALLKRALEDPYVEVQQFAAAALVRIEDTLQRGIEKAHEAVDQLGRASDYAHLGQVYCYYARMGILNRRMSRYFLARAVDAYRLAIEIEPTAEEVYYELVEALIEINRIDEAARVLEMAAAHGVESNDLIFERGRIDYHYRDFDRLMELIERLDLSQCRPEQREAVEFWLNT